jgi:hypothetical protein
MAEPFLTAKLQAALEHHVAGRLDNAEMLEREVLRDEPQYFKAMRLLGLLAADCAIPQWRSICCAEQRFPVIKPAEAN